MGSPKLAEENRGHHIGHCSAQARALFLSRHEKGISLRIECLYHCPSPWPVAPSYVNVVSVDLLGLFRALVLSHTSCRVLHFGFALIVQFTHREVEHLRVVNRPDACPKVFDVATLGLNL